MSKGQNRVFSRENLKKEWKMVRWTRLKSSVNHGEGALSMTGKVLVFAGTMALLIYGYEALITLALKS